MTQTATDVSASAPGASRVHPAIAVMSAHATQIGTGRRVTMISDDPEGPHDLRIGLRRLRTALGYFKKVLPADVCAYLSDEAQWLGREAGALRDLDVLLTETLAKRIDLASDDVGLLELDDRLHTARLRAQVLLRKTLAGPRVGRFLAALDKLTEPNVWTLPKGGATGLRKMSERIMSKRLNKAKILGDRFDTLNETGRHDFRKELKKLRYSAECAYDLHGRKNTLRFVKSLKVIQDQLGAMNDATVAREILETETGELPDGSPAKTAAKATIRKQTEQATIDRKKVAELWASLAEKTPI
ncbi:MAG: CHAD domain-containing protein [Pseudomonadota bacterium]